MNDSLILTLLTLVLAAMPVADRFLKRPSRQRRSMVIVQLLAVALLSVNLFYRPAWFTLGLRENPGRITSTPVRWKRAAEGLFRGRSDISAGGVGVDTMRLIRFDQGLYTVRFHHDAAHPRTVEEWMKDTGAVAIMNGSYYGEGNHPLCPLKIRGEWLGPSEYRSTHGALSISDRLDVMDLLDRPWRESLEASREAMLGYPLLKARDRTVTVSDNPEWLANRAFVGVDSAGDILFGVTETGFFSLRRLARFLEDPPFDVAAALNMDGGPVVSLGIADDAGQDFFHAPFEVRSKPGGIRLLTQRMWPTRWKLPIVVAVYRRGSEPR